MHQCKAIINSGERCKLPAQSGTEFCHIHQRHSEKPFSARNPLLIGTAIVLFIVVASTLVRPLIGQDPYEIGDILGVIGLIIAIGGYIKEQKVWRNTIGKELETASHDKTKKTLFRAKLDSGLYGGAASGVLVGMVLGIAYYSLDPKSIHFLKAMAEIIIFMGISFSAVGIVCQLIILFSRHQVLYHARNPFLFNEITSGIVGGLVVGVLIGPIIGWYFGQYVHDRPFAPPNLVLSCCIPGGMITGLFILLYDKERIKSQILKHLGVALIISFLVGGIGFSVIDTFGLEKVFFDAMYADQKKSSLLIGGTLYTSSITILLCIHIGMALLMGRVWTDADAKET